MIKALLAKSDLHFTEVLKGSSSAFLIRIFGTALGFAVSLFVARLAGAEGAGVYFFVLSIVTIAAAIGRLGFDNTVVRFIASNVAMGAWGNARFAFRVSLAVVLVTSLGVSTALYLLTPWLVTDVFDYPDLATPLTIGILSIAPAALGLIVADALRGLKAIPSSQWVKTVFTSLGTLILLYPLVMLWGVDGTLAAYSLASIATALLAIWLWLRASRRVFPSGPMGQADLPIRTLFESSTPLLGVALTSILMKESATILLGTWGDIQEVGIFNVAIRIANLLLFPLLAMISVLGPKFAAMHRQGAQPELMRLARSSSKIMIAVILPISLIIFVAAPWILSWFGDEFVAGTLLLRIMLVGVFVNTATGAVAEILMMSGHEKIVLAVNAMGALILLVCCFVLIPRYSATGAALAVATSYIALNLTMLLMVRMKFGIWPVGLK